jgi:hypothetical protein
MQLACFIFVLASLYMMHIYVIFEERSAMYVMVCMVKRNI